MQTKRLRDRARRNNDQTYLWLSRWKEEQLKSHAYVIVSEWGLVGMLEDSSKTTRKSLLVPDPKEGWSSELLRARDCWDWAVVNPQASNSSDANHQQVELLFPADLIMI